MLYQALVGQSFSVTTPLEVNKIIDSGGSNDMTRARRKLMELVNYEGGCVSFGGDSARQIKGLGYLMLSDNTPIHNIYFVEG